MARRTPTRGERFAAAVRDEYELGTDEEELVTEAARTLDLIDRLEAVVAADGPMSKGSTGQVVVHPAVAEARQARVVLVRLLGSLGLALAEDPGLGRPTPAQQRGRVAASARWGRESTRARRAAGGSRASA